MNHVDFGYQQLVGILYKRECQANGDEQGTQTHNNAFQYQPFHDVLSLTAKETSGSHLPCSPAGLCHREVDVVENGEQKDHDFYRKQHVDEFPVASRCYTRRTSYL